MNKQKAIQYILLALRAYLAFYLIAFGYGKLSGNRLHISAGELMLKPIGEVNSFFLGWYLFKTNPIINIVVGVIQIMVGLLIAFNRTVIIGCITAIPVLLYMLLVEGSFCYAQFGINIPIRFSAMLISNFILLYRYRTIIKNTLISLADKAHNKTSVQWWVYACLIPVGCGIDFLVAAVSYPFKLAINYFV